MFNLDDKKISLRTYLSFSWLANNCSCCTTSASIVSASSGNVDFGVVVVVVVVTVAAVVVVVVLLGGDVDFVMAATDRLENGSIVLSMSSRCCSSH
jgi:hypothetical protein